MMSFWDSELGKISGDAEAAYAKTFTNIPDCTMAVARIQSFTNASYMGNDYLQIQWVLTEGEFAGRHVFHKLYVFDQEPKKRHRFLNLLKLIYQLFNVVPTDNNAPTDQFLRQFENKIAGIKIQLTEPNKETGKQYNWVSEVHSAKGFDCVTGYSPKEIRPAESAFDRDRIRRKAAENEFSEDDIPF